MGQRLVVTIDTMGREIAKIYYHWSAYTFSALLEVQKIVNCIYNHEDESEKELLLRLIRFCEANGGGIDAANDRREHKYIQALYPNEAFKTEGYSRNDGLIAISEEGMDGLQDWSEGDMTILIDDDEIVNTVYSYYESLEEYNRERKEWDDEFEELILDDVPEIGYDLSEIAVEDLDDLIDVLRNIDYIARHGNDIFEFIE